MEVLEGAASGLLANLACELISSLRKKHHGIRQKERLEELLVIIHSVISKKQPSKATRHFSWRTGQNSKAKRTEEIK